MTPEDAPCAGGEFTAAKKIVPINMIIDAEANVIFFKNYTRILGLPKKEVRLRFSAFVLSSRRSSVLLYSHGSLRQPEDSLLLRRDLRGDPFTSFARALWFCFRGQRKQFQHSMVLTRRQ